MEFYELYRSRQDVIDKIRAIKHDKSKWKQLELLMKERDKLKEELKRRNPMNRILKDDTLMPWGKYVGMKMSEVPANYLLYLKDIKKIGPCTVLNYINDNEKRLREATIQKQTI